MSNYRIIYPNSNDGIAVVVPAPGIELELALQAVPQGSPYLVVNDSEVPSDRTFRAAWTADFSNAAIKG